jgi:hypothetical protein
MCTAVLIGQEPAIQSAKMDDVSVTSGCDSKFPIILPRCWARKVRKYLYLKSSLYNVTVRHEVKIL